MPRGEARPCNSIDPFRGEGVFPSDSCRPSRFAIGARLRR